jgi:hypothetical protein
MIAQSQIAALHAAGFAILPVDACNTLFRLAGAHCEHACKNPRCDKSGCEFEQAKDAAAPNRSARATLAKAEPSHDK